MIMAVMMVIYATPVFAYIDPGTGSYIFQMMIAVLVGTAFTLKIFWNRIKGFLGAKKRHPNNCKDQVLQVYSITWLFIYPGFPPLCNKV